MNTKRIAIIGSGQAGLVSAKYALRTGMKPCIFEKSCHIGGLWSPNTAIWEGLYANISKHTTVFSDHPWPKNSSMFASKQQLHEYMISYAKRYKIDEHIQLNSKIESAKQVNNKKWQLNIKNLSANTTTTDTFDHLIIASGLHSKPRLPEFKNKSEFEGIIMHSSEFKLNDPKLKDKNVLVLGFCISGIDVSSLLVGHAKSVTNVFPRPYLVAPRLIAIQDPEKISTCKIMPYDLFFYTRKLAYETKKNPNLSREEKSGRRRKFLKGLFPLQTDKSRSHSALFFDVNDEKQETLMTISDDYIKFVDENKITPKRTRIEELSKRGVLLEDGTSLEHIDAIICCTGYDSSIEYLEKQVVDCLKYRNDTNYKHQYTLSKFTFHPNVENLALVGQIDGLFFTGSELQAKLASLVFSGKIKMNRGEMRNEIEKIKSRMNSPSNRRLQFPYGTYVEICDQLAKYMNLLPDLEALKASEPQIYHMLWNNSITSPQFRFKKKSQIAVEAMNEVNEIVTRVYQIQDVFDFENVLVKFKEFYKYENRDKAI